MTDELTLKIGRRGAQLLLRKLMSPTLRSRGEEKRYLENLCFKLRAFSDKPPPKPVNYRIITQNKHGEEESDSKGH